ncbi:MAG: TM2 domain-containing protein [Flavobacteriales bacterium]
MTLHLACTASGPFQPLQGEPPILSELAGTPPAPTEARDPRATAAVLAVFLGPFGAHRLHLGTSPKVVVIYGATLGGFGILPLIDLGHLLFARDQERFRNNDKLLMWR